MLDRFLSQSDRNAKAQLRLFTEFWWLWAIKQHWRLGFDTMMVSNTQNGLFSALLGTSDPTTELWIVKRLMDAMGVERVPYKHGKTVGEMLYASLASTAPGAKVLYVVACSPSRPEGAKTYVIYRPKEGSDALVEDLFDYQLSRERAHEVTQ